MAALPSKRVGASAAVLLLAGALIAKWEGVRFYPYVDPVGIVTVCYGHTGMDIEQRAYTRAECEALLDEDMREANSYVRSCIARPMPESVEAALTSLVFNLGPAPVCIKGLDLYNKAGKRVFRGLVLRRADERKVCERGLQ